MRGRQVVIPARLWSIHGLATYMDWLADGMVAVRHVRDGYSSLFSGRNNPLDEAGAGRGDKSRGGDAGRSEEHTSELQSLMRISYAVFCLKKKKEISRKIKIEQQ